MKPSTSNWTPLSLEDLKTVSLHDRPSKVKMEDFGEPWRPGNSFGRFLDGLPRFLAAEELRQAIHAAASTVSGRGTVLLGMGAHPIKVGLNPLLIDALKRGLFRGVALNGAGIVHDVELALAGKTSEDVGAQLTRGGFGTARETAEFIHEAVRYGREQGDMGLGRAVGRRLLEADAPYEHLSLTAAAASLDVPLTVHVALGTDIVHMHPGMDGAATGELSYHDFRLFCRLVSTLRNGVYINLGSAVILPEVFLKAVSVACNLGYSMQGLTTVTMDFQQHYRPRLNVAQRPTADGGKGIYLVGHHEIMLPLLLAGIMEALAKED